MEEVERAEPAGAGHVAGAAGRAVLPESGASCTGDVRWLCSCPAQRVVLDQHRGANFVLWRSVPAGVIMLMVADLMSDTAAMCLMSTAILVLAHRECGARWFWAKLDFKVPTRVKRKVIVFKLVSVSPRRLTVSVWKDDVWFQALTAIKGIRS